MRDVVARWSAQFYEPADGLPYVGRRPKSESLFIAIGFAGVGLVQGTLAASVLRGALHALSPTCTHMGCIVHWNAAEQSWDCPCHGGRFSPRGEVLTGPPLTPLRALPVDPERE